MELIIISPSQKKTVMIAWIELDSEVGNLIIQPGHAPMIVPLASQRQATICLKNGKQETIAIPGGIAEVTRDTTTLLLSE